MTRIPTCTIGMYDIFLNFVDPDFRTPEMRADFLSFKVRCM